LRPVLFLIPGHAFCGYWRSESEPEDRGVNTSQTQADLQALEAHFSKKLLNEESDIIQLATFTSDDWPHIRAQISNGVLVPLETTLLTMRESWSRATEEGEANLDASDRFEKGKNAMLDIGGARLAGITPLPLKEL
jgi:hypothetical protein